MNIDKLTDYIDKFFPDCTLCNDTDHWEDGRLCICNGFDETIDPLYTIDEEGFFMIIQL